jgi:hypothetical protein
MPEAVLVVFIDAYPFWALQGSRLPALLPSVHAVRPGFGYSINCQTELFIGKTPDEVGYWCEYSCEPGNGMVRGGALGALDFFRPWRLPNRALHKVVERVMRQPIKDIPFGYLRYFRKTGKELFSHDFPFPSVLTREGVRVFSYKDFLELPTPEARDRRIFDAGIKAVQDTQTKAVVLALGNLDQIGHWYRPGTDTYWACRDAIEQRTIDVMEVFARTHPRGTMIVISDHGMSPIDKTVRLDIERAFGVPRPERYLYFVEGTILRIWSADARLREELQSFVSEFRDVEVIAGEERTRLGVSNPSFGDIIAVTHDHVMWVPSFWGAQPSAGMHGYHPRYEQQLGIFLSNRAVDEGPEILEARQVATILEAAFPGAESGSR